ncbi:MAG: hypothetical protein WBB36_14465 [Chitinophagales bacterium]|uniref:Uncharacterized protein n=1 Tax=Candidatus Opimibacter skivensis TaxID=2982028 RepID=A0A9D7T0W4_9BACT|nr:hypothetical protein [Candidatus Opimibacter skivensis]
MLQKNKQDRFKSFKEGFNSVFDDWGDMMDWKEKSFQDELNELIESNYRKALKQDWNDVFSAVNDSVKRFTCCVEKQIEESSSEAA